MFTLYDNPDRDAWFRKNNPDRADKILIPYEGSSEILNEYHMHPFPVPEKDIDIFAMSRLHPGKNLDVIAESLKIYRKKYPQKNIRMTMTVGKAFDINLTGLDDHEKDEFARIESKLTHVRDYIDLVPHINWHSELPRYFSRAKLYVMGALLEGRNRSIYEAMACNTPVVCFQEFNQYARGKADIFSPEAGRYSPYDPEALADTFHTVLENQGDFKPRQKHLETLGL